MWSGRLPYQTRSLHGEYLGWQGEGGEVGRDVPHFNEGRRRGGTDLVRGNTWISFFEFAPDSP